MNLLNLKEINCKMAKQFKVYGKLSDELAQIDRDMIAATDENSTEYIELETRRTEVTYQQRLANRKVAGLQEIIRANQDYLRLELEDFNNDKTRSP